MRADVERWLPAAQDDAAWDLVVVDPPYAETAVLGRVLELLGRPGAVKPGGRVVVKHFWRDDPPARVGLLASERERRFGESALTFYRSGEEER